MPKIYSERSIFAAVSAPIILTLKVPVNTIRMCLVQLRGTRLAGLAFGIILSAAAQVSGESKNCMECHAAIKVSSTKATSHEGVASCATCHTVHADPPPPKTGGHFLRAASLTLCNECHANVSYKEFVHPPVKMDCTLCHNPHGGLRAESNALCLECHSAASKSKFESDGPVALFNGQITVPKGYFQNLKLLELRNGRGHPVSNHPVFRKEDQDWPAVSCVVCHKPHGADKSAPMLVTESETFVSLCQRCHK